MRKLAVVVVLLSASALRADERLVARPPAPAELPEELRSWADWVVRDDLGRACPTDEGSADSVRCAWPGRLVLDIGEQAGKLQQSWRVYAETLVPLPGGRDRWPLDVRVDGAPAVVIPGDAAPLVRLTPGEHTVTGELRWDAPPEALRVPPETGLLALTVRGAAVPFPQRAADGTVFLEKKASGEASDAVDLRVYRRVVDEVPLLLYTRVELSVSGKNRELLLGRALPDGFTPLALDSALPARLEADSRLRVQVRPGTHFVELLARHDGPVAAIARPAPGGPWTEGDEAWVFEAHGELRQVLVEGVRAIDPKQTSLPAAWARLPAYALAPGDAMKLVEQRRGDAEPAPDQLSLDRDLWLDFDGGGYTVRDTISGKLNRSWRLEMAPEAALGHVVARNTDQFITRLHDKGGVGVELRQGNVVLLADSRIEGRSGDISATSWDADFDHVAARLHLPPGWRLLHASGADEVRDTWLRSWTLLDLFLVLVIAFATGRLFGAAWGGLALVTLVLVFPENDAPRIVWLVVLAAEALVRVLPVGRVARVAWLARLGTWAALILISLPFAIQHLRHGMYPALDSEAAGGYVATDAVTIVPPVGTPSSGEVNLPVQNADQEVTKEEKPPEKQAEPQTEIATGKLGAFANDGSESQAPRVKKPRLYNVQDYDKNVVAQTGPGVPRWGWRQIPINWSGPVERSQRLSLVLVPPSVNLVLAAVRVTLLTLLIFCLIGFWKRVWPRLLHPRSGGAAVLALLFLLPGRPARADAPSDAVLAKLRERLLTPPACRPSCASSPRMELELTPATLRARLEIGVAARTAVPLPAAADLAIDVVTVDGRPTTALRRGDDGGLWLALEEGLHQVAIEARLPPRDVLGLALPLKPRHVVARATGWNVAGLHEDGVADDNLQLTRVRGEEPGAPALQPTALPPFVRVEREVELALGWSVTTRVIRVSPPGTAIVLEVPLLAGESVTTENVRVQNGKALVNMGPQVSEVSWSSVLAEKSPIELVAPAGVAWTELWRLDVSPVWHATLSGIPVIFQQDSSGDRLPEWRPWPGEKVAIEAARPAGVPGQTLTIDHAGLEVAPGARANDATLTLEMRSSRGGPHVVTLPDGAQLTTLEIAGVAQPARQDGRKVTLALAPGTQTVRLVWREPRGIAFSFRAPEVDLGTAAVNLDVDIRPPQDRWILFLTGPRLGPAVLFWSLLLVLLVVALALDRVRVTPLRAHHWALLAVGLSQVPVPAAAVVAAWFVVMGLRRERPETSRALWFDLRQIGLVIWALAAAGVLVGSITQGLLGQPEMQILGHDSGPWMLRWFADRTAGPLPRPVMFSVPLLVYRGAMLAWALWLAVMMLSWARWSWQAFSTGGLWRRRAPKARAPLPTPPPAA